MRYFFFLIFIYFTFFAVAQTSPASTNVRGNFNEMATVKPVYDNNRSYTGIYQDNKKWGFAIRDLRQPAIYDSIVFAGFHFIVKKANQYAIANRNGQVVGGFTHDSIAYDQFRYDKFFLVKRKNKYGIIDTNLKELIPIKFKKILLFNNFLTNAVVESANNKIQLLNIKKEKVFPIEFDFASIYRNAIVVKKDGKFGIYNSDKLVTAIDYDSIYLSEAIEKNIKGFSKSSNFRFYNNQTFARAFIVRKGDKYGLIDTVGRFISDCEFDNITIGNGHFLLRKDKLFGLYLFLYDKKVEPVYTRISELSSGKYIVTGQENNCGVIDSKGNIIIPLKYDYIENLLGKGFMVSKDGKVGIISSDGVQLIDMEYQHLKNFSYFSGFNRFIAAKKNDHWGVVDTNNKIIIPLQYDDIYDFNDLFLVSVEKKQGRVIGLYDKNGALVLPVAFKWIRKSSTENSQLYMLKCEDNSIMFSDPHFQKIIDKQIVEYGYVENDERLLNPFNSSRQYLIYIKDKAGKFGAINEDNFQFTIPIVYDSIIQRFAYKNHTYFSVRKGRYYGLINENNQVIIPIEYDSINLNMATPVKDRTEEESCLILLQKDKKWGAVDIYNHRKIPFEYVSLEKISHSPIFKAKKRSHFMIIDGDNRVVNEGPYDDITNYEYLEENGEEQQQALAFYNNKMTVLDARGIEISEPVDMQIHQGYRSFEDMKVALIAALDSKDTITLRQFAKNIAPDGHLLFFLKTNMFTDKPLEEVNIPFVQQAYYEYLKKFQQDYWLSGSYDRLSLTDEVDYTLFRDGWVTNQRLSGYSFGGYIERILRDALKINGYWISSYFMSSHFNNE